MKDQILQIYASRLDIFLGGVLFGVVCVFIGQWAKKALEMMISNNQLKMNIELGKYLKALRDQIDHRSMSIMTAKVSLHSEKIEPGDAVKWDIPGQTVSKVTPGENN